MALSQDDKDFIRAEDMAVYHRIKVWIFSAMLTNLIAIIPIIFFLGGIYSDGRAAVRMLAKQDLELNQRARWMQRREAFEMSMELWAKPQGYVPPRYVLDDKDRE